MNLEDIKRCGRSQSPKDNTVGFSLHKIPRAVKFTEAESRMVMTRSRRKGGWRLIV